MKHARLSLHALNTKADALASLLDGGFLDLYAGSRPTTPEAAAPATALARLHFADPAFAPADAGVSEAHPLRAEDAAPAAGHATWFRCVTADGRAVVDGSVGTNDADLVLSTATILVGTRVTVDRFELVESADVS